MSYNHVGSSETLAYINGLEVDNTAKDKRIAELEAQLNAQTCYIPPEFQAEMDGLRARVASLEAKVKVAEASLVYVNNRAGFSNLEDYNAFTSIVGAALSKLREPT